MADSNRTGNGGGGAGGGGGKPPSTNGTNNPPGGFRGRRVTTCSFCGKSSRDVGPMVEGPSDVYICANCVDLAHNIIRQEKRKLTSAQPLFTRSFAVNCQEKCHSLQLWTGFKPPIEDYAKQPAVARYVSDLKRTKPDADEFNAFTEGGYVGMLLLEDALKRVGPDLTRVRLKAALDSTCLDTGLLIKGKLCYSPTNRYANVYMQGFEIQYSGTFAGWRSGPIVRDPGV